MAAHALASSAEPKSRLPLQLVAEPKRPLELETVSSHWQLALDAAQRALTAEAGVLCAGELRRRSLALGEERRQTLQELTHLARLSGVRPAPWLSPVPLSNSLLGLPDGVRACVFDLDGVLTDSGVLHARAWAEVFDDFLLRLSTRAGWQFVPFDRDKDYRAYIDGRRRLEGVWAFLQSRGIALPDGRIDDPADAETACGLARRKDEKLKAELLRRGPAPLAGARRYVEAAGRLGLRRAVVSASANTAALLELSGLATLFEARIDADAMQEEGLRSRPAPDVLLAACRALDVPPERAVTFTHSAAGVAAGSAAGLAVVGVAHGTQSERLLQAGAERVVGSLGGLLDARLTADLTHSSPGWAWSH
jgi:HAD superfamily hydrolase (TIGR01509 family)